MKNHRVEFVEESDLPAGVDWLMTRRGDAHTLFVRGSAPLCSVLSEAWVAFHRQVMQPVAPEPRVELTPLPAHTFMADVG